MEKGAEIGKRGGNGKGGEWKRAREWERGAGMRGGGAKKKTENRIALISA